MGWRRPRVPRPRSFAKLNAETQRIFSDPAFRDKFLAPNFIFSVVSSPDAFAQRIRSESAKWGQVIRDANVRVE
jgi:tripartite-type tricarboxylate transporter receptor subunit TctC